MRSTLGIRLAGLAVFGSGVLLLAGALLAAACGGSDAASPGDGAAAPTAGNGLVARVEMRYDPG